MSPLGAGFDFCRVADVMHAVLAAIALYQIAVGYALDPLTVFRYEVPWYGSSSLCSCGG